MCDPIELQKLAISKRRLAVPDNNKLRQLSDDVIIVKKLPSTMSKSASIVKENGSLVHLNSLVEQN